MSIFSSKHPNLTLKTQAFVDELAKQNSPPLYTLSYEDARKVLSKAQSGSVRKPDVDMQDIDLPVGPTGSVSTRIIRPQGNNDKLPVCIYVHGGGWVMGDKETHDRLVRELATQAGIAVVYPNYTPSPEAQYPTPTEELYAAMVYIADHGDEFNLDSSRLAVCGDSAGGNMATVLTILSKQRGGPRICFQCLLYPVTIADFDTESYKDFSDGPWLTKKAMKWFWDAYAPDSDQRDLITVSPLKADSNDLKGLPPALIITDENDVLRDEGEAYGRKLMAAGVPVTSVRYNGTHHDFMMLDALADTTPAIAATAQAAAMLKQALVK